jgi:hypothetical protein
MKEQNQKLSIELGKGMFFLENSLIISLDELILIEFSVSVYAPKKGRRGVDDDDLWYGIIECFCVDKRPKAFHVCFEI